MGNPDCQRYPASYLDYGADGYSGACFPRNTDADMPSTCTDTRFEQVRVATAFGTFCVERAGAPHSEHTILLLHGFGVNSFLWRGVTARLARAGCLVLAPDLLGHGVSEWPADASLTFSEQADALAAALRNMERTRVTVVGQDTGGLVALALAARHPDMVRQLVIINPPDHRSLPPAPVRRMLRVADRLPAPPSRTAAPATPAAALPTHNQLAATALVAALLANGSAYPDHMTSATMAHYLAPWLVDGGAAQLCSLARELSSDSLPADTLAAVVAPTLVLRGDQDSSVPADVARTLAGSLENARLRVFPQHGRLLAAVAPDALARTLLAFITDSANPVATEAAVQA